MEAVYIELCARCFLSMSSRLPKYFLLSTRSRAIMHIISHLQSAAIFLAAPLVSALTYRGADFSSLDLLVADGQKYYDNSSTAVGFETILAKRGTNLARIRIWTSTNDDDYSLDYGLALASKAYAAGMEILVDLHYSDTWADPGNQAIPSSWPTTLSGLNTEIYDYTKSVVTAFEDQGTPISIIQIGNEINDGLLFPVGSLSSNNFTGASQLLNSAASAVRQTSSSTKIMIHLANGWDLSEIQWWYDGIFIAGEFSTSDFDIMGFSFYPFYGTDATLSNLETTLSNMISTYGKDVIVVETNWPESCSGVALSESISVSAAGQQTWVNDIKSVLEGLSGGHGKGIVYWEPGWIGNAGLGSSCADNLLVDSSGQTRSSIAMFNEDM